MTKRWIELALKELTTSPIYRNLLVSETGDLTAVQVSLQPDKLAESLLDEREALRSEEREGALDAEKAERFAGRGGLRSGAGKDWG